MTPDSQSDSRLRELFLQAVELADPVERQRFLEEACTGNAALRAQIDDLLTSHKEHSFLQHPAIRMDQPSDPSSALTVSSTIGQDPVECAALPSSGDPPSKTTIHYFGDYELIEEIARGGMGVVWKARQVSLNRIVALKMILAGKFASEADVKRFRLEAEAAANLQHPNIVAIHEVGEHEGRNYFSMDYVEGKNLTELLRDEPVPPSKAAQYVKTTAEAIQYAHQRGILHRDLKPQNVLIDERDQPRVTDFGLAKLATSDGGLTQTGAVMGSPSYMPPEQAAGRYDQVGPHSDVYSLGAVLYELLTRKPPHEGATPVETLRRVLEQEATPPSRLNPLVNSDLEIICLKCLEKDPQRRYATARELSEDLGRFLTHEPIRARRANPVRRVWSWFIRHPWIVTGAASLMVVFTLGFGYRMWERVNALEWAQAHPKEAPPFGPDYFFPNWFNIGLFFEFFFFQLIPLVMFLIHRGRKQWGTWFFGSFAAVGVAQSFFGMEVLRRAVASQAWDSKSVSLSIFASIAALTNVWFGTALAWGAIREARLDLPGIGASDEPVEQPLGFTNRGLISKVLFIELFAGFASFLFAGMSVDNDVEKVGGFVFGPFGLWATTGMLLTGRLISRSRGLERQSYAPLFILSTGLAIFSLVGMTTATWYAMPLFMVLGTAVGKFLTDRSPLQRGYWLIAPPERLMKRANSKADRLHFSKPWLIAATLLLEFLSLFWLLSIDQKVFVLHGNPESTTLLYWFALFGSTVLLLTTCFVAHTRGLTRFGLSLLLLPLLFLWIIPMGFSVLVSDPRMNWRLLGLFYLGGYVVGRLLLRLCPLQRGAVTIETSGKWLSLSWMRQRISSRRTARLALRFGIGLVFFYLVEDWRGIHAWNKAKARLEAQGAKVEWSAFVPKKGVRDAENVFKHPFMQKYGIRRGWTTSVQNPKWWDHGFVGYGLDAGIPIPMATLKKLPRQPESRSPILSRNPNRTRSQDNADIAFTNSPLTDVVRILAGQAGIDVTMDLDQHPFVTPKTSQWDSTIGQWRYTNETTVVSFNTTNSTPEAALDALLQNHHLRPEYNTQSGVYHLKQARVSLNELMDRLSRNDSELRQLDEALQRPHAQLDWTEDTPLNDIPSPDYVLVRTAAQGLATRSKIHLLQDNPDAALRDVLLIGRVTQSLTAHRTLVGGMMKVALGGLLAGVLEEGLAEGLWPATHLEAVQKTITQLDLLEGWYAGMEGERAIGLEIIRRLGSPWRYPKHGLDFMGMLKMSSLPAPTNYTHVEKLFAIAMLLPPRGWFYQNMVSYLEMPNILAAMDLPRGRIRPANRGYGASIEELAERRSPYTILTSIAIPNFNKALTRTGKIQTQVNQAIIACALERHRVAKGSYPETLAALLPEFAAKLPHDLFDGQPLRYRRMENGRYVLYSIGWNSKDDGGALEPLKEGESQAQWSDEKGDWVWQGVPKR